RAARVSAQRAGDRPIRELRFRPRGLSQGPLPARRGLRGRDPDGVRGGRGLSRLPGPRSHAFVTARALTRQRFGGTLDAGGGWSSSLPTLGGDVGGLAPKALASRAWRGDPVRGYSALRNLAVRRGALADLALALHRFDRRLQQRAELA